MYLWEALLSNVWALVLWIAIILIKKFSIQWFAVSIQCPKSNQKDCVVSIWLFTENGLKYTSTLKKWGFKKAKHKQNKLKAKPKSRWQTNFLWFWISFLAYLVMHLSKKSLFAYVGFLKSHFFLVQLYFCQLLANKFSTIS